jgi:hypothetical protein
MLGGTKGHRRKILLGHLIDRVELDALRQVADMIGPTEEPTEDIAGSHVHKTMQELTAYLNSWNTTAIGQALDDVAEAQREDSGAVSASENLETALSARLVQRLEALEDRAQQSVENLQQATREGGKTRLSETFAELAVEEADSAALWNKGVLVFVVLGIALPLSAIWLEDRILSELTGLTSLITKALIAVPLLAMATYCGRISAQHRKMAQHLRMLTAQVNSVRAFVDGFPDQVQHEIIAVLGRNAYSDPGIGGAEGAVGIPPEQVMPAIEKLAQSVKDARG